MHKLIQTGSGATAKLAVVEVKAVKGFWDAPMNDTAEEILSATLEEFGIPYSSVARYSLAFAEGSVSMPVARKELAEALKGHQWVLALGADATKALCYTKKTLTEYAGSMTWNEDSETYVLPTFHPSVVLQGKYDQYDALFDHVRRMADILTGELEGPNRDFILDYEFIGHNGTQGSDKVWSGYFEATEEETSRTWEILNRWLLRLRVDGEQWFALDTESFDTDFYSPLTMVQVYDPQEGKAYAFNWGAIQAMKTKFRRFLNHQNSRFVLHNTKHDRKMLKHWLSVDLGDRDMDTMMYALGLTEKGKQCGLKYLSRQYCNAPFYEENLDEWLDQSAINYGHIRPDVLAEYGCLDVYYTFRLSQILPKLVEREGTAKLVTDILMPAQRTLSDVEQQGMHVDLEYAKTTSADWGPKIDQSIQKVQEYAKHVGFPRDPNVTRGQAYRAVCECVPARLRFHLDGLRCTSFAKSLREDHGFDVPCNRCADKRYVLVQDTTLNVNSPTHMQHLCFDILDMQETHKGRKCDKDFWKLNAPHPLAELVAEYKEMYYLRRNFLEGVQRFVSDDGKVHPDFLLFGTKTGRLAIHNPAMQTVPQHGDKAKAAKRLFTADPDCVIINADYKALEMYMAHHLTKDENLIRVLTTEDVHRSLAAKVYNKDYDAVTDKERQSVKSVNFGAGYGIGGKKLATDPAMKDATGGDPERAQEFIDTFWRMYPQWSAQCDEWRAEALTKGRISTELGRVRRWSLITNDNQWSVRNQAINFSGQSMASDLCLTSLVKCHKALQDRGWGRVLLTVHDSLVFNIRKEVVHEAVALVTKIMTTPVFDTETPFSVDVEVGLNYGEKSSYDKETDYANL